MSCDKLERKGVANNQKENLKCGKDDKDTIAKEREEGMNHLITSLIGFMQMVGGTSTTWKELVAKRKVLLRAAKDGVVESYDQATS